MESPEQVVVMLTNPQNISFGRNIMHSITINDNDTVGGGGGAVTSVAAFAQTLHPYLRGAGACLGCHGTTGSGSVAFPFHAQPDATMAHNELINFGKVDLMNPGNSRLVTKIQG